MALTGQPSTYLERCVDGLVALPCDLQRLLSLLKDIDDRCEVLRAQVQKQVDYCVSLPSQSSRNTTPDQSSQVAELRIQIEKDQKALAFLATEKLMVAQQAMNTVKGHVSRVDSELAVFSEDLQAQAGDLPFEPPPGKSFSAYGTGLQS
ncbi:hypothetical protein CYMTET_8916 [Cymbomonas tetramitiformis]|uniref:Inhibitor of growth protein N-terminal histone-binding domain-containing protein n=1 Tax=Cymbomonas tetramitiformis TaxID=36881 RepID=A0AAE0LFJ2_9CHLO|nr:hypothetical protein CYMTET_8916 [Cymbomonas tetramitiformis]